MKQDTLEGRAKTKNGVIRLCFSVLCILLEAAFIIIVITRLNEYAEIVNLLTRVFAGILVLALYASDQTSSMKMPWIILILVFPIMGVALYLLIGLNGGTRKMRERYADIDRKLLPLLPDNREKLENIKNKIPKAGNISEYIWKNAGYPVYQNTDIVYYADSPMDDEQVGEEVYISMINKAEKYCWFITPYLIITDEMTHALCLAAKRGVDVRIITPGIPDKKMIYSVTRSFYHGLVKNGVRIYEWTPGFCHAKMSVVDDCMATCGTINLDYRSLYHHFENGCFMADSPAVLSIRNDLEETMKECREVTEQYRTGRSAYLRLGQLFMRLFAGLL